MFPSIAKFTDFVQLKSRKAAPRDRNYRQPTKDEWVRYVGKLAEHHRAGLAALTEDQLRALIRPPPGSLTPAGLRTSVEVLSRLPKPLKSSSSCA